MRLAAPWTNEPGDQQIIAAVRDLAPSVAALGDRIDAERKLPEELVAQLRAARVFEMYVPRTFGGPEVHPLTAFTVAEELARRDGSVGWCSQVAAAVTVFLAWIDPAGVQEMIRRSGSLHLAGSARPLGTAEATEGGFRASGHWDYASGVRHANWYLGTCFVQRPNGPTTARSMLFPVSDGTIVGNWNVMGMRGTGSDDFVLQDVFVPDTRVASRRWIEKRPEPLYDPRLMMITAWAPTAGVGIGLAEGALDALLALGERRSAGSPVPLREREAVQEAAGRAGAMAASARAFVVDTIGAAWDALGSGADNAQLERAVATAQLAITNTLNEAVRVADVCFHAAGTNAISVANRLERFLRDTHTAVQHSAAQPVHLRAAGRVLFGLDAGPVDPSRDAPTTPRP